METPPATPMMAMVLLGAAAAATAAAPTFARDVIEGLGVLN
jgi:hypothetical protein